MKSSSVVALICALAINGFNAIYQQPAIANLLGHEHIAEAITTANNPSSDEIQVSDY